MRRPSFFGRENSGADLFSLPIHIQFYVYFIHAKIQKRGLKSPLKTASDVLLAWYVVTIEFALENVNDALVFSLSTTPAICLVAGPKTDRNGPSI